MPTKMPTNHPLAKNALGAPDTVLEQLLYNRSGPIAAAIAVTVEAPDGVDFALPELTEPAG
ncbi:MAG: hypothetical protein ABI548_12720 [Polyangiaceae bacterium]